METQEFRIYSVFGYFYIQKRMMREVIEKDYFFFKKYKYVEDWLNVDEYGNVGVGRSWYKHNERAVTFTSLQSAVDGFLKIQKPNEKVYSIDEAMIKCGKL